MADGGWVLVISKPTGYELRQMDGEPPELGAEVDEDGVTLRVSKIGASPLPGDSRKAAFTQAA